MSNWCHHKRCVLTDDTLSCASVLTAHFSLTRTIHTKKGVAHRFCYEECVYWQNTHIITQWQVCLSMTETYYAHSFHYRHVFSQESFHIGVQCLPSEFSTIFLIPNALQTVSRSVQLFRFLSVLCCVSWQMNHKDIWIIVCADGHRRFSAFVGVSSRAGFHEHAFVSLICFTALKKMTANIFEWCQLIPWVVFLCL